MSEDDPPSQARYALDWPETPRTPGNPAGQSPAEMRLQWDEGTDQPDPQPTSAGTGHDECRREIERLEALVAELRREVTTLRRRAQLRAR